MGRTSLWWWGNKLDHRLWAAGRATREFGRAKTTFSLRRATIDSVCEVGGYRRYEALLHLRTLIPVVHCKRTQRSKTNA